MCGGFAVANSDLQLLSSATLPLSESAGGDSSNPVLSRDGRFVLFCSTAHNLVAGTNGQSLLPSIPPRLNVYVRDRQQDTTRLVSAGTNGLADDDCFPLGLSADGRYALFESAAANLVPGDANGVGDIFLRDLLSNSTHLVSMSTNGLPGNAASRDAVMTPDGRYVAFVSAAKDLVPGDTNRIPDVFVRDMDGGVTTWVSVGARSPFFSQWSGCPSISDDGRYVAFLSSATNLVPGLTLSPEVYVRDLVANTTVWASVHARSLLKSATGISNAFCFSPSLSSNGSTALFAATLPPAQMLSLTGIVVRFDVASATSGVVATNVSVPFAMHEEMVALSASASGGAMAFAARSNSPYTTGSAVAVRLWTAGSAASPIVSADANGVIPPNSFCQTPVLSGDGLSVAFISSATGLVTNALSEGWHLYCRDTVSGITRLVDADTNNLGVGIAPLAQPQISFDGRFVAFSASAGSLVPGDGNQRSDVFVRDLLYGTNELISLANPALRSTAGNSGSFFGPDAMSQDGRFVAFRSAADNLVTGDTNGCSDVFLRDRGENRTLLISRSTNGSAGSGVSCEPGTDSSGRYVVFTSAADDLVPGDTNRVSDVFIYERQTGTLRAVSCMSNGTFGYHPSSTPLISPDARYVVFRSRSRNLAPVPIGGYENAFVRETETGTIRALTGYGVVDARFAPGGRALVVYGYHSSSIDAGFVIWDLGTLQPVFTNAASFPERLAVSYDASKTAWVNGGVLRILDARTAMQSIIAPATGSVRSGLNFSTDGRYLVFASPAALVAQDTNASVDIYVYDLRSGAMELISRNLSGSGSPDGSSEMADISPDGRLVAYCSAAINIVPDDDLNGQPDLFIFDRTTRLTTLISRNRTSGGTARHRSSWPRFSTDRQTLFFLSASADLTGGDFNNSTDLFALPVHFLSLLHDGQSPLLQWPAVPGRSISLQFNDTPGPDGWRDVPGIVTNTGYKMFLRDAEPASSQRFYRILLD